MTTSESPSRYHWVVDVASAGRRLDHFLVEASELGSRSQISKLIAGGRVRVDGVAAKGGLSLRVGQRVEVEKPPPAVVTLEAEPIELGVVFEDESLLAIDKPAGLVVHPAPGHWSGTLVNALLHRWQGERRDLDPSRCGIVHRLDKDTSGLILVAKNLETHAALSQLFRRRTVRKEYTALVCGVPRRDRGEIDAPIGRHPVDRKRMAVRPGGRQSVTCYEVVERYLGAALVRALPRTGRTHQIRVHLASIGNPVLADPVYARGRRAPRVGLARQALHAERLHFTHPHTGAEMALHAPLPGDMSSAVATLRERAGDLRGGREVDNANPPD